MPDSLPSGAEVQSDCGQKVVLHFGEVLRRKGTKRDGSEKYSQQSNKQTWRRWERSYMLYTQHTHQRRSPSRPRGNIDQETAPSPCEPHCEYTHDHNCLKDYISRLWNWLSIQTGHLEYLIPLLVLVSHITYCLGRTWDQGSENKCGMSVERCLRDSSEESPLNVMKPDHTEWS